MKTSTICAFGAAFALGLALSAPREASAQAVWTSISGCAMSSAGSWVIGCDAPLAGGRPIYHWNGASYQKVPNGLGVTISPDPNGNPWVVNDSGRIFAWNGINFPEVVGNTCEGSVPVCARHGEYGISTLGIGPVGSEWLIDCNGSGTNYSIRQWTGSCWQLKDGLATQITVDHQGTPWVINASYGIYRRVGGVWQPTSGAARSISGFNGVQVIGTTFNLYAWTGSGFDPSGGKPAGVNLRQVVSDGQVIDTSGGIWVRSWVK